MRSRLTALELGFLEVLKFAGPISLALLALGTLLWIPAGIFCLRSQETTGSVVRNTEKNNVTFPIFSFTDASGAPHTIEGNVGSAPPAYAIGQAVPVRYLPRDPNSARIADFWNLWGLPLLVQMGSVFIWVFAKVADRMLRASVWNPPPR